MIEIVVGLATTVIGLWLGSIEYRMRNMDTRMRCAPSRKEVDKLVDIKQESVKVMQQEIKEDIRDVKATLTKLVDLQMNKQD